MSSHNLLIALKATVTFRFAHLIPSAYYTTWWCVVVCCVFVLGCKPDEAKRPAYLNIAQPLLVIDKDTVTAGANVVWLFQAPEVVGTFQTPVRVPLIYLERNAIQIRGGVRKNDPNNTEIEFLPYPFWRFYNDTIPLMAEQSYNVQPIFTYVADTLLKFPLNEGFEGLDVRFTNFYLGADSALLRRSTVNPFRGRQCGVVNFDSTHRTFVVLGTEFLTLPRDGRQIFIEVAYKGDIKIGAYLYYESNTQAATSQRYIPQMNLVQNEWQTAYFDVSADVAAAAPNTRIKLGLYSISDGAPRTLYIDDIRVIHFTSF